jgi:mannosidase alpha-like ER degradation enhancer 2
MEFSALSRLTGDSTYEKVATRAMKSIWEKRSSLDLIGNHINVQTGKWTGVDSTIGSGVDSYFEYLVKAGILLNEPEFLKQFKIYQKSINKFLMHDSNWFVWANMDKGHKTLPLFSSLEAFYPGNKMKKNNLKSLYAFIKKLKKLKDF